MNFRGLGHPADQPQRDVHVVPDVWDSLQPYPGLESISAISKQHLLTAAEAPLYPPSQASSTPPPASVSGTYGGSVTAGESRFVCDPGQNWSVGYIYELSCLIGAHIT